jgi:hypothetical protein
VQAAIATSRSNEHQETRSATSERRGCLTNKWTYTHLSSPRINFIRRSLFRHSCTQPSQAVRRTPHSLSSSVQNMSVHHGSRHVPVPQQLLHGPDIIPRLEQMCSKGMPQRVAARPFSDTTRPDRLGHGSLDDRLMQMMPLGATRLGIQVGASSREDPLPGPGRPDLPVVRPILDPSLSLDHATS